MHKVISNSFSITASKDVVSIDHNDNYSLIEASGNMPSANDERWQFIPAGGQALMPTPSAPYLWHKTVAVLTDGNRLDPVISFGGSLGQNGIDYDIVPSVSSILKAEDNTVSPSYVSCSMIKRNADGSAQGLDNIPGGYAIICYRDSSPTDYTLEQPVSTAGVSVISFVLRFNGIDVERHDIRVISEGAHGIDGRGIQSQDYRYKATNSSLAPITPINENAWNTWLSLESANYSEQTPYLWRCIKTTYINGDGRTDVEYLVEGPTVWGETGNGTASVVLARMFTMGFEAPHNNDAGWILESSANYPTEGGLSETSRYLWQRKETTYTKTSNVTFEISLISQFQSGVRANLLEDTAFLDENEMDGWDVATGAVIPSQEIGLTQNGWLNNPNSSTSYTDILTQKIWDRGGMKKVQPNKWYTLSFYAAQDPRLLLFSGSAYNSLSTGIITDALSQFYLAKGQSATVYITGRINNALVAHMRVFVWTAKGTADEQMEFVDIHETRSTTVSVNITNEQSSGCVFYVCPYMYDINDNLVTNTDIAYRGFCTKIEVDRGHSLNTYINCNDWSHDAIQHGNGSSIYVDGIKISGPTTLADGTVVMFDASCIIVWNLSATPTRHTVTFKMASWADEVDSIHVRFRHSSYSHSGWVSMPKLEENTLATEWMENSADRYAEDYQHIFVGGWRAGTAYFYEGGVRNVVLAYSDAQGSSLNYFRLKKRTSGGYISTIQPYLDTEYWEIASRLAFVSSDLILSKETFTDMLIVSRVQSENFAIDEHGNATFGGQVVCRWPNGNPRITLNEDGTGWLRYYYPNGQIMREEYTDYDENGNVLGVGYCIYDQGGAMHAKYGWNGQSQSLSTVYWRIREYVGCLSVLPDSLNDWNEEKLQGSGYFSRSISYDNTIPGNTHYASKINDATGITDSSLLDSFWDNGDPSANPATNRGNRSTFYSITKGYLIPAQSPYYDSNYSYRYRSVTLFYNGVAGGTKQVIYNSYGIYKIVSSIYAPPSPLPDPI